MPCPRSGVRKGEFQRKAADDDQITARQFAAARYALEFVPLATERYYLAATRRALREPPLQGVLGVLRSPEFGAAVARLPGYDAAQAGVRETLTAALAWLERR